MVSSAKLQYLPGDHRCLCAIKRRHTGESEKLVKVLASFGMAILTGTRATKLVRRRSSVDNSSVHPARVSRRKVLLLVFVQWWGRRQRQCDWRRGHGGASLQPRQPRRRRPTGKRRLVLARPPPAAHRSASAQVKMLGHEGLAVERPQDRGSFAGTLSVETSHLITRHEDSVLHVLR